MFVPPDSLLIFSCANNQRMLYYGYLEPKDKQVSSIQISYSQQTVLKGHTFYFFAKHLQVIVFFLGGGLRRLQILGWSKHVIFLVRIKSLQCDFFNFYAFHIFSSLIFLQFIILIHPVQTSIQELKHIHILFHSNDCIEFIFLSLALRAILNLNHRATDGLLV